MDIRPKRKRLSRRKDLAWEGVPGSPEMRVDVMGAYFSGQVLQPLTARAELAACYLVPASNAGQLRMIV